MSSASYKKELLSESDLLVITEFSEQKRGGIAQTAFNLGRLRITSGNLEAVEIDEAFLANKNEAYGLFQLSLAYLRGKTVPKDTAAAREVYSQMIRALAENGESDRLDEILSSCPEDLKEELSAIAK